MKLQGHTLLQRAALTTFPFNFTSNGTTTTLTLSVFRCHQSLHHERLIFIPTYTKIGPSPRVDVNNNQLQQEEQDDLEVRVEKVSFQVADALDQPFPDGQFDLVWSMESGEHMPDKAKFVSELARVAAPGATIIIVTWCHRDLGPDEESLKPWEEKHLKKICDAFYLPAWCSTADYVRLLESLSLQDIKSEDWSPYVAPFWPAVIRSALSWKGLTSLLRSGLKTIKGALAMPLMIEGFKKDLIKFAIITCRKPE